MELSEQDIKLLEENRKIEKFVKRSDKAWQMHEEITYFFKNKEKVAIVSKIMPKENGSIFVIRVWSK